MRNRLLAALAAMAALALVSCGVPSTPVFVEEAASSDLYEVAAGKLASEIGQSEAVKAFGRHMVGAHSKTSEELQGIVQSEKLAVTLPTVLTNTQQGMLDALTAAKPEAFDTLYIEQQIKAHEEASDLFDKYAERGENQALKQFAANVLPTIKRHLEEARKLKP
jgi:putative membrane protein